MKHLGMDFTKYVQVLFSDNQKIFLWGISDFCRDPCHIHRSHDIVKMF